MLDSLKAEAINTRTAQDVGRVCEMVRVSLTTEKINHRQACEVTAILTRRARKVGVA